MSNGFRGMIIRPEDLAISDSEIDTHQLNLAALRDRLPDPTVYMVICLLADVLIWSLAGFVLYRAIKSCRAAKAAGNLTKALDKYDRLEAGLYSSDYEDSEFYTEEYEPSWAPDAVVFVKDGTIVKKQEDKTRKFQMPRIPLRITRWHSIPILTSDHDYV
ncbi:hypothetical protein M3Y98_00051100 [Aphelenchoides besseyi]|nr:hypothetical protein M3Y98_00051100 [Aphelenchoides besseyi]KAI6198937.1 hypothetical protein M3Y96_00573500 [Aphelenchoides besseyi]